MFTKKIKNLITKILNLLIIFCFLINPLISFGSEGKKQINPEIKISIINDNNKYRQIKIYANGKNVLLNIDKKNNLLTINSGSKKEIFNLEKKNISKELTTDKVILMNYNSNGIISQINDDLYGYDFYILKNKWVIYGPGHTKSMINVKEDSSLYNNLYKFKELVDKSISLKNQINSTFLGSAILSIIAGLGFISGGWSLPVIVAIGSALGYSANSIYLFEDLDNVNKEIKLYFTKITSYN